MNKRLSRTVFVSVPFCGLLAGLLFFGLCAAPVSADFILPGEQPGQPAAQPAQPMPSQTAPPMVPGAAPGFVQPNPQNFFYTPQAFQTPQAAPMAMAYKVVFRQANDPCSVQEVNPAAQTFHTNDRVRFKFQANSDGYLYIFQRGSDGAVNKLFPHPAFGQTDTRVAAYREYAIPANGWFKFDANPGVENVYMFLSQRPLAELDGLPAAGQANPVAVPMNPQVWGVVSNYLNRSARNLQVYTDPGQTGTAGVYSTPTTYAAQMAPVQQGLISTEIQLKHQP